MSPKLRIHITGGHFKGSTIPSPKGGLTRPTPAVLREAVFNVLGERIVDAVVLELFAGVGTLGFEALSRGAAFATFVEHNKSLCEAMRSTAERLRCADRVEALPIDAFRVTPTLEERSRPYSLVFLDPPYALSRLITPRTRIHRLIRRLSASQALAAGARCFLQHPRIAAIDLDIEAIEVQQTRPYGSTAVTIFVKKDGC